MLNRCTFMTSITIIAFFQKCSISFYKYKVQFGIHLTFSDSKVADHPWRLH